MRLDRSVGPPLLFVILGASWTPTLGGDSAAELVLKEKGLAKVGSVFVIEAEKPVLMKMKEVRGSFANYAMLADRQATADQVATQAAQLEEQRTGLQSELDDLNQKILEQGPTQQAGNSPRPGPTNSPPGNANSLLFAQRDQLRAALAEVGREQKALKTQAPATKDKSTLDEVVKKKEEAFKAALADLRRQVDEVTKTYADLGANDSVKASMAELKKSSKAKLKLGPSDAFAAGVKELDQAERRFLGKKTSTMSKKKASKSKK